MVVCPIPDSLKHFLGIIANGSKKLPAVQCSKVSIFCTILYLSDFLIQNVNPKLQFIPGKCSAFTNHEHRWVGSLQILSKRLTPTPNQKTLRNRTLTYRRHRHTNKDTNTHTNTFICTHIQTNTNFPHQHITYTRPICTVT